MFFLLLAWFTLQLTARILGMAVIDAQACWKLSEFGSPLGDQAED